MTKSELIIHITEKCPTVTKKQIEFIVNSTLVAIKNNLKSGEEVEIRGLGSFRVRNKPAKISRNPKTGVNVEVPAKKHPYFRAGKIIREELIKK